MSRELTANWLRQNIVRYQHADKVYTDVLAALDRYPSLRPKTDVYTFDDGRTQLLFCIHGLLPITFRGASYNIPVAVWLSLSYPAAAPLVYVVPTSDMLVKPSAHVDHSGRCSIDYITHWQRKPEACSLVGLLESMQSHFSIEPPLYAKSRPRPLPDGTSISSTSPATSSASAAHRGHVNRSATQPPRLPPKPFLTGASALASTSSNSATHALGPTPSIPPAPSGHPSPASISQTQAPTYYPTGTEVRDTRPPPIPSHPPEPPLVPGHISSTASSPVVTHGHSQSAHGPPPYVSGSPPVPPRPPLPPSPFVHQRVPSTSPITNEQPSVTTTNSLAATAHAYSPPSQPPPSQVGPIVAPQIAQYTDRSGYPQPTGVTQPQPPPRKPIQDLLGEDGDLGLPQPSNTGSTDVPPPPRPPNPQTVALHHALLSSFRDALSRLATTHSDALARQRTAQAELLAGPEARRDESARLVAVRDVCRAVGDRWEDLVKEGERALEEMRRRGEVSVDELVCADSIVGNQLANLVAEDNATEDTIYHLHRALVSGRIDLERFLRTTRVLAEEQFMKRALVEKILRGLPMGMALR